MFKSKKYNMGRCRPRFSYRFVQVSEDISLLTFHIVLSQKRVPSNPTVDHHFPLKIVIWGVDPVDPPFLRHNWRNKRIGGLERSLRMNLGFPATKLLGAVGAAK